jgi:hypothetical protein
MLLNSANLHILHATFCLSMICSDNDVEKIVDIALFAMPI